MTCLSGASQFTGISNLDKLKDYQGIIWTSIYNSPAIVQPRCDDVDQFLSSVIVKDAPGYGDMKKV